MNLTKIDKVFSEFIRNRDADENGYCKCISCGKVQHWKDMDCGHFINRKHLALRWNEINCQVQCRACNRFDEGNIPAFGIALQKKYGDNIIDQLLAVKNKPFKITQFEIDVLEKYYKSEVKNYAAQNT